ELARNINLRNTPQITFILDQSIEYGVKMSKMIHDVTKDMPDRDDEDDTEDNGENTMTNDTVDETIE
ncbi:MAG: ribosome-binding factor A, partial [Clostridia bacterium]|nr:ribosome-binding factor A [Clostridia bacterium]